jgi:hypothetical protein
VTSKNNLSLEQRHEIREIIKELKIEEPAPELHLAIGDTVSKSVPAPDARGCGRQDIAGQVPPILYHS